MRKFNTGLLAMVAILALGPLNAAPLSTAFTYQGNLSDDGSLASGEYDFEFQLWSLAAGGSQVGVTVALEDIVVSGGVFTVDLDFGDEPFLGDDLWLLVRIRQGSSSGGFTELLPRQTLTPAPYALHAEFVPSNSITAVEADTTVLQTRVGGTCGRGTFMLGINQDGSLQCVSHNRGQAYRECSHCPQMVNIPGGSFDMGQEGVTYATPVHEVTVPAFAMGVYEVTWDEWDACVAAAGCDNTDQDLAGGDEGWGRGSRPVINVSWDDAQAYIVWLNSTTGGGYRLPSESEWEYATRAGTITDYWFGDDIGVNQANCYAAQCGDSFTDLTAPVHTFSANAFGLYNVHGNVWEWTEDCWHDNYSSVPPDSGPPLDGTAWGEEDGGDCTPRVVRGGGWGSRPGDLRSANRSRLYTDGAFFFLGFRLAQDQD